MQAHLHNHLSSQNPEHNLLFGYSIAEALKVPRLLEASPDYPVAFPVGADAFDAYHQNHFEKFFKDLNKS